MQASRSFAMRVFPLTPALSLRERENPSPSSGESKRGDFQVSLRITSDCQTLFPLPKGEGQGEGKGDVRFHDPLYFIRDEARTAHSAFHAPHSALL